MKNRSDILIVINEDYIWLIFQKFIEIALIDPSYILPLPKIFYPFGKRFIFPDEPVHPVAEKIFIINCSDLNII